MFVLSYLIAFALATGHFSRNQVFYLPEWTTWSSKDPLRCEKATFFGQKPGF
jgi:hypothetical protein